MIITRLSFYNAQASPSTPSLPNISSDTLTLEHFSLLTHVLFLSSMFLPGFLKIWVWNCWSSNSHLRGEWQLIFYLPNSPTSLNNSFSDILPRVLTTQNFLLWYIPIGGQGFFSNRALWTGYMLQLESGHCAALWDCNLLLVRATVWSRLWFFEWSCMDVRVGLWRKLSAEKLMLLNCGVGEDSWESLGLQGDPTSPS